MIRTYKYRLLPNKAQHAAMTAILEDQRQLYNAALEERIGCYSKTGQTRGYMDQCRGLSAWRRSDAMARETPKNIQRWTLVRIDKAYRAFFQRMKGGRAPGFPRLKGRGGWASFGFAEFSGIRWNGGRLRFATMPGGLRVHLHRPLPKDADIRTCVFRRDLKGWSVCFQIAVPVAEKRAVAASVGIDVGLNVFAHCSDGVVIPNPRIARKAEKEMRRRQRALSRCKHGSGRRQKVRREVGRLHAKIANTRTTWMHQQSAQIVRRYDLIVAEDLNISGMIRNPKLARSISDAGWAKFLSMVAYKAEWAGKHFVTVDPRNTSQRCSGCGELVPKSLAVRTHSCPHCGLVIDRDWNAALNILGAVASPGRHNVTHRGERASRNIKGAIQ